MAVVYVILTWLSSCLLYGGRCRLTIRPRSSCSNKSSTAAEPRLSPSRNTISEIHPSHVSHGPRSFGTAAAAQSCHGSRRSQSATIKPVSTNARASIAFHPFPLAFPVPRVFSDDSSQRRDHVNALVLAETAEGGIPQNRREILPFRPGAPHQPRVQATWNSDCLGYRSSRHEICLTVLSYAVKRLAATAVHAISVFPIFTF